MGVKTKAKEKTAAKQEERLITGEELYKRSDLGPAELVEGKIVRQMPTGHPHGFIENIIGALLYIYLQTNKIGRALTGEVGIYVRRDPDTIRAADIIFISHERYREASPTGYLDVAPELVIEIMSPANAWSEMQEKLAEYFAIGVEAVWVVDPQLEQIHIYHAVDQVTLLQEADVLRDEAILPGFEVPLTDIFAAEPE